METVSGEPVRDRTRSRRIWSAGAGLGLLLAVLAALAAFGGSLLPTLILAAPPYLLARAVGLGGLALLTGWVGMPVLYDICFALLAWGRGMRGAPRCPGGCSCSTTARSPWPSGTPPKPLGRSTRARLKPAGWPPVSWAYPSRPRPAVNLARPGQATLGAGRGGPAGNREPGRKTPGREGPARPDLRRDPRGLTPRSLPSRPDEPVEVGDDHDRCEVAQEDKGQCDPNPFTASEPASQWPAAPQAAPRAASAGGRTAARRTPRRPRAQRR